MAHTGGFGWLSVVFVRGGRRTAVVVDEDKEDSEAIDKKGRRRADEERGV